MKYDSELVEYIVREVIRRLTASASVGTSVAQQTNHELNLTERLVTLATLHGKLNGITQVTIRRRAIVTPAVQDELKQRKIELRRSDTI